MFVNQSFINDALIIYVFPVILEHKRVRGRGQRGDPAEESLDTRHPSLQQVNGKL